MGQKEDNPSPEEDNDIKLAEQFGEFSLTKLSTQETIPQNTGIQNSKDEIPRLDKFPTISEANLKTIISQMPNKSCQLDILNMSTLKTVIDVCITAITMVINLSLDKGGFYAN